MVGTACRDLNALRGLKISREHLTQIVSTILKV